MNIYKLALLALDAVLVISVVVVSIYFKRYLKLHKDETVEKNSEELNSFLSKYNLISVLLIILGIVALAIGTLGKINS